ncbi:hypothetical protein D3C72_1159080 [compost metagenome]
MFQHFHASDHVVLAGLFGSQFFHGHFAVFHLHARLQAVQAGHLERFVGQIDASHVRTAARHRFRQDSAAAADVQHLFAGKAARAFLNPFQPQRIDGVQRLELAFGIPPTAGQGAELVEFSLISIDGRAVGVVNLRGHGKVQRKATLYI